MRRTRLSLRISPSRLRLPSFCRAAVARRRPFCYNVGMGIRNVLFDFDMTLGYRSPMWTETVKELLLENNVCVPEELIRPVTHGDVYPWKGGVTHDDFFGGKSWWDAVSGKIADGLVSTGACGRESAEKAVRGLRERFCDTSYWHLFPDTLPVLEKLRSAGYRLRLLSNHVPEARSIFAALSLTPFFEKMTISSEEEWEKPSPEIYAAATEGWNKSESVMVGDGYEADVLGALRFGMKAILVRKPNEHGYCLYSENLEGIPSLAGGMQ